MAIILLYLLFIPQQLSAAADTASLRKELTMLIKNPASVPVDKAMARLAAIRAEYNTIPDTHGVLRTMQAEAIIYAQAGALDKNKSVSYKALAIIEQDTAHNEELRYFFYNQLANGAHKSGDYKSAAIWYYKSLMAATQSGSPEGLVGINSNIGVLMNDMGKPKSALYYLNYATALARSHKMGLELANALINKAIAWDYLKQRDSCLAAYREAIDIARKTGNNQALISSLYGMGSTYYDMGQPEQALKYAKMALQLTTSDGDVYNSMFTYYVVGNAYASLHQNDSAVYYLQKFRGIAQSMQLGRYEAEANKSLGRLYYAAGKTAEAASCFSAYITKQDSFMSADAQQQANEMQIRYRTAEQEKELIQKELLLARKERDLQQKNLLIVIISACILLVLSGALVRYRQQKKQREEKANQQKQQQQMLQLQAMIAGEEKERRRIARELHDDIGGLLTIARMRLESLRQQSENNNYEEVSNILDKISYGIRGTAHKLLPDIILRHNLPEVMRLLTEPILHTGQLQITVQHLGNFERFEKNADFKLNVYRIVQELVSNILKHAHATEAIIELKYLDELFEITIEDNGRGYDTSAHADGIGLENVRMRVNYLGGTLSIISERGTGTSVYIQIDFSAAAKTDQQHAHTGIHS